MTRTGKLLRQLQAAPHPTKGISCTVTEIWHGGAARDTLLHELVHALRLARGLACRRPLGDGWVDSEEFIAVMVTNMYLSEKGKHRALRGDYGHSFKPLTNPGSFAFDHKEPLTVFRDEMPKLARDLAAVDCRFNPLRDYLRAFASVAF